MKKHLFIGTAIALAIAIPLYAASPDPLSKALGLIAQMIGLQAQIAEQQTVVLQQIADNTENPTISFGGASSRFLRVVSSASATTSTTYFGADVNGLNVAATSTVLTLGCTGTQSSPGTQVDSPNNLSDVDQLGLFLQINASTTASVLLIEPQSSNDCVDWYAMGSLYDQVTTGGSAIPMIAVPSASGTIMSWGPSLAGEHRTQIVLQNLNSRAMRFRVRAQTASSSIWMQAAQTIRQSR